MIFVHSLLFDKETHTLSVISCLKLKNSWLDIRINSTDSEEPKQRRHENSINHINTRLGSREAADGNMGARCVLDYHTPAPVYSRTRIHTDRCNIYCFSTATIGSRTRLDVTLYVDCLSCLNFLCH